MTAVELTLVRREALRPPAVELVLDVVLHNPEAQPRWFLLAGTAGPNAHPIGSAGVSSAEIVRRSGILVAKFSGNVPFAALRLAAGGEVLLSGWPLKLWDEPPVSEVEVEIVTAAGVRIGGRPAEDWFDGGAWISDGLAAVGVELDDARRELVRVPV